MKVFSKIDERGDTKIDVEQQNSEIWESALERGFTRLGVMNDQVWDDDPKRLGFVLARYKFVAKMLSGQHRVLEVGCGDAFASRIVNREVDELTVTDLDERFIHDIESRADSRWPSRTGCYNALLGRPPGGLYDSIYSLDVLEHIEPKNEDIFITNLVSGLRRHGVMIIGMPSLESQAYASPRSLVGHVNCKSGADLKIFLNRYFHNVFLFSMNDEVVHTGFSPMAHYLRAVCTASKRRR
jgi:2-polyprenyl-3-methyl-5-hydroxy-6-metoxy-1,4-benzoquinol methylase